MLFLFVISVFHLPPGFFSRKSFVRMGPNLTDKGLCFFFNTFTVVLVFSRVSREKKGKKLLWTVYKTRYHEVVIGKEHIYWFMNFCNVLAWSQVSILTPHPLLHLADLVMSLFLFQTNLGFSFLCISVPPSQVSLPFIVSVCNTGGESPAA